MWCKNCNRETEDERCELCGSVTEQDIPYEVFWCDECKVPIIKAANSIDKNICTLCNGNTTYLCADLRPVFPEERLLLEIIGAKPFAYHDKAIWASNNRYYINGKVKLITTSFYKKNSPKVIRELLDQYSVQNDYLYFNQSIERFIKANQDRLNYLKDEAFAFIQSAAENTLMKALCFLSRW